MKRFKLYAYLTGIVSVMIIAWFIFSNISKISLSINELPVFDQIIGNIQNLYTLQILILFIPLAILVILVFHEVILLYKAKREMEQIAFEHSLAKSEKAKKDPDEIKKQKELYENEQLEKKGNEFMVCLNKKLSINKPESTKNLSELILSCISQIYEITNAEIFLRKNSNNSDKIVLSATYAFYIPEEKIFEFELGEGLIGQVAKSGEYLYLNELPDGYISVKSGLGSATPSYLIIIPWKNKINETYAIIELASFKSFSKQDIRFIEELGVKLVEFYV